jgi:Flp pilus assembly protein TadG
MRRQRGVTMIGWIFLLAPMAIVLFAAIRIGPQYYEYYKLVSAMKSAAAELQNDEALSPQAIRGALQRRFDTQYVDSIKATEIAVARGETGWEMVAAYEEEASLFGNLHLLLKFNKVVTIG